MEKIEVEYDNNEYGQSYLVDGVKIEFRYNDKKGEVVAKQKAELIAESFNVLHDSGYTPSELLAQRNELLEALKDITDWKLPETNHFWDEEQTQPMSYTAAFGSNGERDYIKGIAQQSITNATKQIKN